MYITYEWSIRFLVNIIITNVWMFVVSVYGKPGHYYTFLLQYIQPFHLYTSSFPQYMHSNIFILIRPIYILVHFNNIWIQTSLYWFVPAIYLFIMHLSIFCPPGGAAGIHGALDRRPFLTGGNLINLWNPGPG